MNPYLKEFVLAAFIFSIIVNVFPPSNWIVSILVFAGCWYLGKLVL